MKKLPRKSDQPSAKQVWRKPRFSREVAILYEDDGVVAVNKPPGLLAVPVAGSDAPSALSLLAAELKQKRQRVFVVHRIDRFASGVLLFAKTQRDREVLVRQFLSHTPLRQYDALVRGHMSAKQATLVHYFRRDGMFQKLSTARDSKAARAELLYSVERELRDASLLRVTLVTGLQNQIRVQFSAIGHPVIGDRKYHPAEADERRISRVALHASRLQFVHPRLGDAISIECGFPPDFRSLVHALQPPSRSPR
ncbi:MAG: RNA pseudouridine synthase [Acidobacteriales bacterium]|nr:RNA pseudouridine synthase [Terriglobales bacterium]